MDIFLIFVHGNQRSCLKVDEQTSYEVLLSEVVSKWPHFNLNDVVLSYTIGRHENCFLCSQADFVNMCMLGNATGVNTIDVVVNCKTGDTVGNGKTVLNRSGTFPVVQTESKRKYSEFLHQGEGSREKTQVEETYYKKRSVSGPLEQAGVSSSSSSVRDGPCNGYGGFDVRSIDAGLEIKKGEFGEAEEYYGAYAMPQYDVCSDIQRIPLLSDGWEELISGEGQVFRGGRKEFKEELIKYATKKGFRFDYAKNNKDYVYVNCKEKYDGCKWTIRGKESAVTGHFTVHHAVMDHDCLSQLVTTGHGRLGPKMWGKLVLDKVRAAPHQKGKPMKNFIHENYGVQLPYFTAYRAVEKARDKIFGSYEASYDQLTWYGEAIVLRNPLSVALVETVPGTSTFSRAFYSFDACLEGFKFCRPMLFVDGCHMIGRWSGTILSATGKDGNNGLFPVAFAIVNQENTDNWVWFLSHLKRLVKHDKNVWYVSDRNAGLMSAFPKVFEEPTHFFCLYHLHSNLKGFFCSPYSNEFRKDICHLLTECAYAPNLRLFAICLAKFRAKGGALADKFLKDLPFEKWAYAYSRHIQRFGEMTSNAAESFNSWIMLARTLPITFMVDTIRSDIMRWFVERRIAADAWHSKLCAFRQNLWNFNVDLGRSWSVYTCPNGNFKVQSQISVEVNMIERTCTCGQWQIHGFPCAHAVAAIRKGAYKIEEVIEPCFFTTTYKKCYEGNINPIPDTDMYECPSYKADIKIQPPPNDKKPGRPKNLRYKSYDEVPLRPKSICPVCGILSRHDSVTCPLSPL